MSPVIRNKIKDVDQLVTIVQGLKAEGKVTVHCHGVFDLLHPGHLRHLQAARELGDVLIVTITPDAYVNKGPGRPVFNQRLREESLAALEPVDYVALNPYPTAVETIRKVKPDVYVKGNDYANRKDDITGKIYEEEQAVQSVGGRIEFTDDITFSSTQLLNSYFAVFSEEAETFLTSFRRRYTADYVIDMLKSFSDMRVLVVGDTIVDEYHYAEAIGKPSKSACISAKFLHAETYAGGALSIANHIAGFCDDVHLVTCLGRQDSREDFVVQNLKPNVIPRFFYRPDAPTVVKRRFVNPFQVAKMFEVCFINDADLGAEIEQDVCAYLQGIMREYDLVIAADFGHGFMGSKTIDTLSQNAEFLAVNAQANSANLGFNVVTKYPRADYVCIDEIEMRLAEHSKHGSLPELTRDIASRLNSRTVSVTLGSRGTLVHEAGNGFCQVPVFSDGVVDSVGAGDAYLSITSLCAATDKSNEMIGFVGNTVGAMAVRIVGNKEFIEPVSLFKFITTLLK